MKNTNQQLEHRLKMIQDDINQIRKFIYKEGLVDKFHEPTQVSDEAWTLLNNIEIACDLTSDECLTWKLFDEPAEQVIKDLKAMDVNGETMQYILEQVGMSEQMLRQLFLSASNTDFNNLIELKRFFNTQSNK